MFRYLKKFHREEAGAVTIDWVVLTAGITLFGLTVATIILTAAQDPADGVGAQLSAMTTD